MKRNLSLLILVGRKLMVMPQGAHAAIECVEIGRTLACSSRSFSNQNLRLYGRDYALRDSVL